MGALEIRRAQNLATQLEATGRRIASDPDLTDDARRRKLETAWSEAQAEVDRLQQAHEGEKSANVDAVRRKLYAPPSNAPERMAGFRQAMDRATSALQGAQDRETGALRLAELLEQAELTGDEDQAHAAFVVADQQGIETVVQAYLADRPQRAEAYAQMQTVAGDPLDIFSEEMTAFRLPSRPRVGGW